MDDVVKEFLVESYENLDEMDRDLVELEQNPKPEDIARIFRTLHTIKGTCGFLGFSRLESVAHASENLLSKLRDGELQVNADIASALLATVDAIRNMMAVIEEEGSDENTADFSDLVKELERLQKGEGAPPAEEPSDEATEEPVAAAPAEPAPKAEEPEPVVAAPPEPEAPPTPEPTP